MVRLTANGISLEYHERGSGEPVVLVHGSASDYRTWAAQTEAFGREFRVINYSRRFHWPNEEIAEGVDYSMLQQVDDLGALLRALDVCPAHLMGHSYGASLCLLLAIRDPAAVRSLVLEEPPLVPLFVNTPPSPAGMLKMMIRTPLLGASIVKFAALGFARAAAAFRRGDDETGLRHVALAVYGRKWFGHLPEARLDQARDNMSAVRGELLGSGFAPVDQEQVRGVTRPVLLVTGDESIPLFRRITRKAHNLLPHAELCRLAATSHLMHEQDASGFNEAALTFLRRHRE